MNLTERHQHIIDRLKKEGSVNVVALCSELNVSSVTIRKDLKMLEDRQMFFRTHGGGTLTNPYATDKPVTEKAMIHWGEKTGIGAAAARLIEPNDCILIASGTTVLSLAKNIKPDSKITVVTSALNVAMALLQYPEIEVIQLPGSIRKTSFSVTGKYADDMLRDFSFSKLFLGVDGIDVEFGLTTTNILEAQLNKRMIAAAQKTVVLADSSKFGKRGFGKICGIADIEVVITDSNISEHMVETMKGEGIEVIIV